MLNWVEVMGLLGKMREAVLLVRLAETWVMVRCYAAYVRDYVDQG